jgi:hypothetical protein
LSLFTLETIIPEKDYSHIFFKKQWEIAVPIFSNELTPKFLDHQTILPFIEERLIRSSWFGDIYRFLSVAALRRSRGCW